jgi:hypothetical protein
MMHVLMHAFPAGRRRDDTLLLMHPDAQTSSNLDYNSPSAGPRDDERHHDRFAACHLTAAVPRRHADDRACHLLVVAARLQGWSFYEKLLTDDGHWAGDYGGHMFTTPGLIITAYVTGACWCQCQWWWWWWWW